MPYVRRNALGQVVCLLSEPDDSAEEFVAATHPDVAAFLADGAPPAQGEQFSQLTDLEMVRVIEDLVDLLIAKNVIVMTDLPVAVQKKLLRQRNRRNTLFGGVSMADEGEKGLF